ncbi:hypothetical protein ZOD2009_15631 [Haladaptatus paucihalophilus DX253]|uniref:Glycosyltransferase RgtA/B/C/D-like domain-containing protein n=1 Tax=Haladaptatus paucihalophilus DX253 TaxID=797209 RepID=E7QWD8_HALPU|nr:hypothetical protein [Haladaptatus paucihalophilus]EFW91034.1 hypothetical protein ZOD2009_15631 [Haladaptatus paucihalophilus DX253]SHL39171.1 hypothetical protein SAMN05444342_3756 [Haladaptatus paucihalophilus DX253]
MSLKGRVRASFSTGWVERDGVWLSVAVTVGTLVYLTYLAIYPYPAHGAGLYLAIAEQISMHGYRLPETIPHYTAGGVPFAYPPLMFYVIAVLHDALGLDPISLTRYLPGLFTVVYLIPYYYLAKELLESPAQAGSATVVLAITPVVLKWHLAAGGIVRAAAFLFVLTGLYTGIRTFKAKDRRWLFPSIVLFTLTILTHPVYTAFFGLSYLLMVGFFDRSWSGVGLGASVAIGGIILAAPWWWHVVSMHGISIFTAAAGTHDGLGGGIARLFDSFVKPLLSQSQWLFYALSVAGSLALVRQRKLFVPTWMLLTGYLLTQDRLLYVAGAMAAAVFICEVCLPIAKRQLGGELRERYISLLLLALISSSIVAGGVLMTTDSATENRIETLLPASYMDRHDERAMGWVKRHTLPSSRFVVLGDAAELFPFLTHRTSLMSPWGVEWKGNPQFERQKRLYDSTSACKSAGCLTQSFQNADRQPEYVYVPKGEYTIRRDDHVQSIRMRRSLVRSPEYTLVFENRGVMIYRVSRVTART